jgi:proteasome lid subunit RPN8/RPN11
MILQLNSQQLQLLRQETSRIHPIEACALLFGKRTSQKLVLKRVVITQNVLESTTRFEINSKAFYDAFMQADKDGLEFIGFFHSHPAPAYPSSIDLEFMRLWNDAVWLIMSATDNKLAAFQMLKGKVQEVTVKTHKT